jgi:hypothetical protein
MGVFVSSRIFPFFLASSTSARMVSGMPAPLSATANQATWRSFFFSLPT